MKRVSSLTSLIVAACIGCGGPDATVQGTVTIDGELAHQGTVQFHPVGGGPTAYGTIANNGSYSLRVGQGDRNDPNGGLVQSGDYIVTAVVNMPSVKNATVGEAGPPTPGARLSAEKYASQDTSDLRAKVKAGANVVPLELERATAVEVDVAAEGAAAPAAETTDGGETVPQTAPADDMSNAGGQSPGHTPAETGAGEGSP